MPKGQFVDVQTSIPTEVNEMITKYIRLKRQFGVKISKKELTAEILTPAIKLRLDDEIRIIEQTISEINGSDNSRTV